MKVVCAGDSTTYGQNVRSSEAWPAVLERLTGHDVRNEGVCGDTSRLGLERFPKAVQLHSPAVVVLQFGANDANCWETDNGRPRVSKGSYVENLREMALRAAAFKARFLILRPHTPRTCDEAYNERVRDYDLALVGEGLGLCPPSVSLLDDGYGVHPDVDMHERYAQLVADAL